MGLLFFLRLLDSFYAFTLILALGKRCSFCPHSQSLSSTMDIHDLMTVLATFCWEYFCENWIATSVKIYTSPAYLAIMQAKSKKSGYHTVASIFLLLQRMFYIVASMINLFACVKQRLQLL
uniref:Uncharacterized protein n=1 Tax=Anguilla anguilla TaxID=7936 RepID=A0A0E9X707_ANGAN